MKEKEFNKAKEKELKRERTILFLQAVLIIIALCIGALLT